MSQRPPLAIRDALSLLSIRLLLQQIGVALAVSLLFALWLRLPDGTVLDLLGTVTLGLVILAFAGAGESLLMLRLSNRDITFARLLRGTVLLCAGGGIWLLCSALLSKASANDSPWASYINSQLPHAMRYFFTWSRIYNWLEFAWTLLEWLSAGIIFACVFAGTTSQQPRLGLRRIGLSALYWLVLIVSTSLAIISTTAIMGWTPGHGLHLEMFSLVLRLTTVILLDSVIICLLLALAAVYVRATNARTVANQSTPEGTPEATHPRTVENP